MDNMDTIRKKCIVAGCKNYTHQGMFVGDMCMPCHHAITTGNTKCPTTAFWGDLREENDTMTIPSWDELFLRKVYLIASKSKDTKTKIGAVIVDGNTPVSEGYNGMAKGVNDNVKERYERPEKYFWMSHAERNSIFHCARRGVKAEGTTLYTQGLPCSDCADAVINSGIKKVITHANWENIWRNISHDKWIESEKRTKQKFSEANVVFYSINIYLNCKTLIDGKVYIV